jgi:dipeptidyl-peptidase 4
MQTPETNPTGYAESKIVERLSNLKGSLLLMHGTADDNVHFQNSAVLALAMIDQGRQFETMFYPDRDHSISGPAKRFLYEKMTQFLKNQLSSR